MKARQTLVWSLASAIFFAAQPSLAASPVIDDVNGEYVPGNFIFAANIQNVGWVYTPGFDYELDGITSLFRAISSPPVATRDVTLSVYDEPPADGGNLLRTGTFSAGQAGGNLGIMFEPLPLEAGEDYFIGFENVPGLGLNIVDFAVSLPGGVPNPDVEFLSGWYTGANFETFIPNTEQEPAGFAAPILYFQGVIPEPSTFALMLCGVIGAAVARRRRS